MNSWWSAGKTLAGKCILLSVTSQVRVLLTVCVLLIALPGPALAAPVSLDTFVKQARPEPNATLSYGPTASQGIDIFLPETPGLHPVVILIHGGCWKESTAGREQLRAVGKELANQGVAVWSIGYRRVDEPGGAYPGIFQDVATAVDLMPAHAAQYHLDPSRVVAVGHSAGAHLALWAASRGKLPLTSPAYSPNPFPIATVIGLGGVGDLQRATDLGSVCGATIVPNLIGQPSATRPDAYADTSPARLLPTPAKIVMITGSSDEVTPPTYAETYVGEVKKSGGIAEMVIVQDAAHFDVVTVSAPAWQVVRERILGTVKPSSGAALR